MRDLLPPEWRRCPPLASCVLAKWLTTIRNQVAFIASQAKQHLMEERKEGGGRVVLLRAGTSCTTAPRVWKWPKKLGPSADPEFVTSGGPVSHVTLELRTRNKASSSRRDAEFSGLF